MTAPRRVCLLTGVLIGAVAVTAVAAVFDAPTAPGLLVVVGTLAFFAGHCLDAGRRLSLMAEVDYLTRENEQLHAMREGDYRLLRRVIGRDVTVAELERVTS